MPDTDDQDDPLSSLRTTQGDRHTRLRNMLRLALQLGNTKQGMTLTQMRALLEVSPRTAERYRDDLIAVFGLEERDRLEDGQRLWRLPAPQPSFLFAPRAEELASLSHLIALARTSHLSREAGDLEHLQQILLHMMEAARRRRVATDLDALIEAQGVAHRPGPREKTDPAILEALQAAILSRLKLQVRFKDTPQEARVLHPLGILLGTRRRYLIAFSERAQEVRQYRISRMLSLEILVGQSYVPPEGFTLTGWSAQSFGVFQEAARSVVLRFLPSVAEDVRIWLFHPNQEVTHLPDGGVEVRFTTGGMLELAWHLVTWGNHVRILEPEALRDAMRTVLKESQAALSA